LAQVGSGSRVRSRARGGVLQGLPTLRTAMATSELMKRHQGKCPKGHELVSWKAKAGHCDGCGNMVFKDDHVMDCRACNWYLCSRCHPQPDTTFWGAITQHFNDIASEAGLFLPEMSCGAPSKDSLTVDEIDTSARDEVVYDPPVSRGSGSTSANAGNGGKSSVGTAQKFCTSCGYSFKKGTDKFCPSCGTQRLQAASDEATPTPEPPEPEKEAPAPKQDLLSLDETAPDSANAAASTPEPDATAPPPKQDLLDLDEPGAAASAGPAITVGLEAVAPPPEPVLLSMDEPAAATPKAESVPPVDMLIDVSAAQAPAPSHTPVAPTSAEPAQTSDLLIEFPVAAAPAPLSAIVSDLDSMAFAPPTATAPSALMPAEALAPAQAANAKVAAPAALVADAKAASVAPIPALSPPPGAKQPAPVADDLFADFSAAPAPPMTQDCVPTLSTSAPAQAVPELLFQDTPTVTAAPSASLAPFGYGASAAATPASAGLAAAAVAEPDPFAELQQSAAAQRATVPAVGMVVGGVAPHGLVAEAGSFGGLPTAPAPLAAQAMPPYGQPAWPGPLAAAPSVAGTSRPDPFAGMSGTPAPALQMASTPAPAWSIAPAAMNPPMSTNAVPFTAEPGAAAADSPPAVSEVPSRVDEIGAELFAAASAAFQLSSLTRTDPAKEEPAHAPTALAESAAPAEAASRLAARPAEALVPGAGAEALASVILSEQEGIRQLNDLPCKNLMINPLDDICSVHKVMVE